MNRANFQVDFCSDPNCLSCNNDTTVCLQCNNATGYYLNTTAGLCQTTANLTSGSGPNLVANILETCKHASCVTCSQDSQVCTLCNIKDGMYLANSTCFDVTQEPKAMGLIPRQLNLVPCSLNNCSNCLYNATVCQRCDEANYYYLIFSKCILRKCIGDACKIQIVRSWFDTSSRRVTVEMNGPLDQNNTSIRDQLNFTIQDLVGGTSINCSAAQCNLTLFSSGFYVDINLDVQILMGNLTITKINDSINPLMSPDWVSTFDNYPILIRTSWSSTRLQQTSSSNCKRRGSNLHYHQIYSQPLHDDC